MSSSTPETRPISGSPWFWALLAVALLGVALGGTALFLEVGHQASSSGPPVVFERSFVIGKSGTCGDRVPSPSSALCSRFNITVPGTPGGLRWTYINVALNATCYRQCSYLVDTPNPNATTEMPFLYGDIINRSQVGAGVLAPGQGFVELDQAGQVCGPSQLTCSSTPLQFTVTLYDLGELAY